MQTLKNWIITALAAFAFLVICSVDDGFEEKQHAADDVEAAQTQAQLDATQTKRELKSRQIYMDHLLSLDRLKK
jgi:hypothetical protein